METSLRQLFRVSERSSDSSRSSTPGPSRRVPTPLEISSRETDLPEKKVLDFDIETLAAGFADPNWVPQKITCAAWSWVGSDRVETLITGKDGFFNAQLRGERLRPLLDAISQADMLTGHNILRFDLPVINAECIRTGQPTLKPILVQDTMRIVRTKGLKKGQDNLSELPGIETTGKKQSMTWIEWDQAYEEEGWKLIISRAKTDVIQHKEMREKLLERGVLRPNVTWRP